MDIENNDFCYGKIQLPYYNSIFGDPNSNDWATRYGGNYGDQVVVGWEITSVTGGTEGTLVKNWQDGYNFADRDCTNKDKERIFAQGGYYYVPNGVSAITITAKWAYAVYLDNSADHSYDRVYMSYNTNPNKNIGYHFAPNLVFALQALVMIKLYKRLLSQARFPMVMSMRKPLS